MKMKNRIFAACTTVILALGVGLISAAPAQAVYGNKVQNSSNRCTSLVSDAGSNFGICGLNNYAYGVKYIRVPRGTCLQAGYWSFTTYCASGKVDRLVPVGSGTTFVR